MKKLDTYLDLCTQFYELSKPEAPKDAYSFYRDYVKHADGSILEPMCGSGRFLLPLLKEGFDVKGFDASQDMLKALRLKAEAQGLSPEVWQGYVEQVDKEQTHDLIFIPSGSLGLLIDESVFVESLKMFYSLLKANGFFVFEVETLKAKPASLGLPRSFAHKRDDGSTILGTFFDTFSEENILTTVCRYELVSENKLIKTEIEALKVKLYDPKSLRVILNQIGFSRVNLIKAFDKRVAPDPDNEVVVFECIK